MTPENIDNLIDLIALAFVFAFFAFVVYRITK
jgi:hypothetical protein